MENLNDKKRITKAFRAIRKLGGIAALQNVSQEGVTEEQVTEAGGVNGACVYYSRPSTSTRWGYHAAGSFDRFDGTLTGVLNLSWKLNDAQLTAVVAILRAEGLAVTKPESEFRCIEVRHVESAVAPEMAAKAE